jgi:hypothetical protein
MFHEECCVIAQKFKIMHAVDTSKYKDLILMNTNLLPSCYTDSYIQRTEEDANKEKTNLCSKYMATHFNFINVYRVIVTKG